MIVSIFEKVKKIKFKFKIILLLVLVFICWVIIIQSQTYKYPKPEEIIKRINYLQKAIEEPLDNNNDILKLGHENPEWMLFSYSFTSYAMTNLAIANGIYKSRATKIIKASIEKVLNPKVYACFNLRESTFKMDTSEFVSVLYLGHLNLMLGCYRLISEDTSYNSLNDNISKYLYFRYSKTRFLNLESYPSAIWIPDNAVSLASLKLYSKNTGSNYDSICSKWIDYAKIHYIDKETGVICSTVDPVTGEAVEGPRGSMLGWAIMFINQFDSAFANEMYYNYKKHFSYNFIIFRLFKERPKKSKTNTEDIDSGPLIMGYSIPANEFALGASILANDYKTAAKLERLIRLGTKEIGTKNELKYKTRFIELNISPMAEALVLFSLTQIRWTN